jgi:Porin PorA
MKRRVIGTVLFGVGVALVVLAAGLRFYVAPMATQLPYDLKPSTAVVVAKNATFLVVSSSGLSIRKGDLQSTSDVRPQPVLTEEKMTGPLAGTAVVWDVYSVTVAVSDKTVVDASTQEIALDRKTGAAADWSGAWENGTDAAKGSETKVKFQGYQYKLPFYAEKVAYPFWDGTLVKTFPAEFKSVETVGGVEAYKYVQVVPLQAAPMDEATAGALAGTYGDGKAGGKLFYGNTRTLLVEPTTGQFLNVREQRRLEYRGGNGTTTVLLDADFNYSDATAASTLTRVKENVSQINLVSIYLPIGAGFVGLGLIIAGLSMVLRSRRPDDTTDSEDRAARHLAEV